MSCCERCWADAYRKMIDGLYPSQTEAYNALLKERKDNPCLPKEQAGQWWDESQFDMSKYANSLLRSTFPNHKIKKPEKK